MSYHGHQSDHTEASRGKFKCRLEPACPHLMSVTQSILPAVPERPRLTGLITEILVTGAKRIWEPTALEILVFLTCVNEPARGSFAELLGFVRKCHLHNSRDVPGRGLHPDGVGGYKLRSEETRKYSHQTNHHRGHC